MKIYLTRIQLMIYDDPTMTQLVPGATVLPPVGLPPLGLPPSLPVLGLAPGQEIIQVRPRPEWVADLEAIVTAVLRKKGACCREGRLP